MSLEERVLKPVYAEKKRFRFKESFSKVPFKIKAGALIAGAFITGFFASGLPTIAYHRSQYVASIERILADRIVTEQELETVRGLSEKAGSGFPFIYPSLPGLIEQAKEVYLGNERGSALQKELDFLLSAGNFDPEKATDYLKVFDENKELFSGYPYYSDLEKDARIARIGLEGARLKERRGHAQSLKQLSNLLEETQALAGALPEDLSRQQTSVSTYLDKIVKRLDAEKKEIRAILAGMDAVLPKIKERAMDPRIYTYTVFTIKPDYIGIEEIAEKRNEWEGYIFRAKIDRVAEELIGRANSIPNEGIQNFLKEAQSIRSRYEKAGFPVWDALEDAVTRVKNVQNNPPYKQQKEIEALTKEYSRLKGDMRPETYLELDALSKKADALLSQLPGSSPSKKDLTALTGEIASTRSSLEETYKNIYAIKGFERVYKRIVDRWAGWGGLIEIFFNGVIEYENIFGTSANPETQENLKKVHAMQKEIITSARPLDWDKVKERLDTTHSRGINFLDTSEMCELELSIFVHSLESRLDEKESEAYKILRMERFLSLYTIEGDQLFLGKGHFLKKPDMHLRSRGTYQSTQGLRIEFRNKNAYDKTWNPKGNICNFYQPVNEIVYDNRTGLMWTRDSDGGFMTFNDAHSFVDELNKTKYKGYSDWRLPTAIELGSIYERTAKCGDFPSFSTKNRDGTESYHWGDDESKCRHHHPLFETEDTPAFWTSDRYAASDGTSGTGSYKAWVIDFKEGNIIPADANQRIGGVKVVRSHVQ